MRHGVAVVGTRCVHGANDAGDAGFLWPPLTAVQLGLVRFGSDSESSSYLDEGVGDLVKWTLRMLSVG